jgi:GNAT superfamily N-acetyltransferase
VALRVERFGPATREDFRRLHSEANGAGWCRCVAWWVPTWDGWGDRTAQENAELRERLCDAGQYDGLVAYGADVPVGWCQLGPRDRLEKLRDQLELGPDPGAWAVSCFFVAPAHRRQGVASALLEAAIGSARENGAHTLEAYPRPGATEAEDAWTGPNRLYSAHGFGLVREVGARSVVELRLGS